MFLRKTLKIHILLSHSRKLLHFSLITGSGYNDVAEEWVYHTFEIFFVNFWVTILCPVFVH